MLFHVIDFIVDYFTNLNARKIFGGIIVLIGIAIMGKIQTSEDINSALLYGILGILVGGIGFVIIYYDMAKDKLGRENDDLHLITTAHKQHTHEKGKISSWHIDQVPDEKVILGKK